MFLAGSDFPAGGLLLPGDNITWSIQFQGLGTGDDLGVDLYDPPTVGWSYRDYRDKSDGTWMLKQDGAMLNFASRFLVASVPDQASTLLLSLIGGVAVAGVNRFRKRQ